MQSCKILTIAQQKGGSGKTNIAINLAVTLSKMRYKVSVIDIDPQGSSTQWHNIREENLGKDYTGINFLTSQGWKVDSDILCLKNNNDFIIIDSPPHTQSDAKSAIRAASLVLIPVQPSPTDLWATKATIDLCQKENIPYSVVLNRVSPNSKLASLAQSELNNVLKTQIGNRVIFASSMSEGKSVIEIQPKGQATEEIKALTSEILKALKNKELKKAA
jgi:chromosome partitioning protein